MEVVLNSESDWLMRLKETEEKMIRSIVIQYIDKKKADVYNYIFTMLYCCIIY